MGTLRASAGRKWVLAAVLWAVTCASAQRFDKPFHTLVVLPAVNETGKDPLKPWTLGWQYLLQERLREFPGIDVPRFSEQSKYIDLWLAGQLDVTKLAVRNEVAAAFGADLVVAPTIVAGPPEWSLKVELMDRTSPQPKAYPPFKGSLPTVVLDAAVTAVLKDAFGEDKIALEPWGSGLADIREDDVAQFVGILEQWPYTERADAAKGALDQALLRLDNMSRAGTALWLMWQRMAFCQMAAGKPAQAAKAMEGWVRQQTQSSRPHLLLGRLLAAAGQDSEAALELTQAANISKGSLQAVLALGACLKRMGKAEDALHAYEAAALMWPNVRPFQMARGQMALDTLHYEVAAKAFRLAAAQAPAKSDAWVGLVTALLAAGHGAEAVTAATELLRLTPDDAGAKKLQIRAALADSQVDVALAAANKLVAAKADDAEAQSLLGTAAMAKGDYAAAITALTQAAKLAPKDLDVARLLSSACIYGGKPELAAAAITAAMAQAPDTQRPALLVDLAKAQFYAAAFDESLKSVRASLAAVPTQPAAKFFEARLLVYKNDLGGAIDTYKAAIALAGADTTALATAITELEGDRQSMAKLAGVRVALGFLYEGAGRGKDARRTYRDYEGLAAADAQWKAWCEERVKQIDNPRPQTRLPGTSRPI